MHSRIFILSDNRNDIDYPDEIELMESLPKGVDYIATLEDSEYRDSIEWLKAAYNLELKPIEERVYEVIIDDLKASIMKNKIKKIDWLKEYLKKPIEEIDMWQIGNIYHQKGFFYYHSGYGVMNEFDLLENFNRSNSYIIQIYDYHF